MNNGVKMPDYYRGVYKKWYSWFSHIYDPFRKLFFFFFNGGFGGEKRFQELIIEWINPQKGERILDICCGTGTLTIMLAGKLRREGRVVGIEISPDQLRVARKKEKPFGLSFLQVDAQDLRFSDCYFDKAVICGALHEMPEQVRKNVLSESYRVIKPKGRIVIVEHNKPDRKWKAKLFDFLEWFNPEYPTYENMLECGLTNEIGSAGFRIIKTGTTSWEYLQIVMAER